MCADFFKQLSEIVKIAGNKFRGDFSREIKSRRKSIPLD